MKNLIKQSVTTNGDALDFEITNAFGHSSSGHIQMNRNEWAIFFNAKCVHVSKTLNSAINKLQKLGVSEFDFIQ
jgi:hypothetical protein